MQNTIENKILPKDVERVDGADEKFLDGALAAQMMEGGAAQLRANVDEVNQLNVFPVPDGDTGDNMYRTIESGVAAMTHADSLSEVASTFSKGMLLGARGNSGVILSQFFGGFAKGLEKCERADVFTLGRALEKGVRHAYRAVMTPTEGTILTVAREAVEYAVGNLSSESTVGSLFADLEKEMFASVNRTPERLQVLKDAGVIDSGGAGLFHIFEGFCRGLRGEELPEDEAFPAPVSNTPDFSAFDENSVMTYGYCTELLLQLQTVKTDLSYFDVKVISDFLSTIGDSIVSVREGSIVKIHVHTKTPEKVLAFCRQFGEFLTVKIENMSLQHNESIMQEQKAVEVETVARKKYGICAVCSGEGIVQTFYELGVDVVVDGGQTNNPSTNDFLDAFDKIPAEHIFVFPNNSNIFLAAGQAAALYDKAKIHVIESKNIGAGYVAIATFDPDANSADALEAQMREAMEGVTTGFVSPATRDASMDGVDIHEGEYIGFFDKTMIASTPSKQETALILAEKLTENGDKFMLTVFCGKDTTAEETATLEKALAARLPSIEVYFSNGGQDVYPYIFMAE